MKNLTLFCVFTVVLCSFAYCQNNSIIRMNAFFSVDSKYPWGIEARVTFSNLSDTTICIPQNLLWSFGNNSDTSSSDIVFEFEEYDSNNTFKSCNFRVDYDQTFSEEIYEFINPNQISQQRFLGSGLLFEKSLNGFFRTRLRYKYKKLLQKEYFFSKWAYFFINNGKCELVSCG